MKLKRNIRAIGEFRRDLRRGSWALSAAIFSSTLFGAKSGLSLIAACAVWVALQLGALVIGLMLDR